MLITVLHALVYVENCWRASVHLSLSPPQLCAWREKVGRGQSWDGEGKSPVGEQRPGF